MSPMKIELLRLLSAQASQYELSEHSWEALQPADIAHALGLIKHKPAAVLGRIMFADQTSLMAPLTFALADRTAKRLHLTRNPARLALVCYNAIQYFIDPKLCSSCHGAESIQLENTIGLIKCQTCEGTRMAKPLSQRQLAEFCDIPWSSWQEHWGEVYDEAEYGLHHYLDIVIGALAKRLADQPSPEPDHLPNQHIKKPLQNKRIDNRI